MNPVSAAHADSPESTGSADRKRCPATPRTERIDGDEEPRPGVEDGNEKAPGFRRGLLSHRARNDTGSSL